MQKQSEIIKQLTDKELVKQLVISQMLLLLLAIILSLFFFGDFSDWAHYFRLDGPGIIYYGVLPGLIIVILDILFVIIFPEKYYDDGGINDKIFRKRPLIQIAGIALITAISEELLFRGVLQTTFGYVVASIFFAVVHIRYLKKPLLLISVLFVSFYIGYIFLLTENLYTTITAHFVVDFLLGAVIRFKK
ncbi:CPBP family intramembrane glutamic endopeptidase [Virgibacillus kekensis]|uniref:CPBP family intramembrane glutamic endopeptidase n=1 Tax=Virgibacillus kekensis TaxID=202261 RepID=A0ABV9DHE3_9BACI